MSSTQDHPISHCHSVAEAWHLVNQLGLPCGIITLTSDTLNGGFAFMDGRIVGAYIDESGERNEQALAILSNLQNMRCDFLPFHREQISEEVHQVFDVITSSEPIYVDGVKQAAAPPSVSAPPLTDKEMHESSVQTVEIDASNFHPTVELPAFASMQGITPASPPAEPPARPPRSNKRLTPEVAAGLFKDLVISENLQEFLAFDGSLADGSRSLTQEQMQMLEIIKELSDPDLFEETSEIDLQDATTLSEEQKKQLEAGLQLVDTEEFQQRTGRLDQQGLLITDDQLFVLGEVLAARSLEQQKDEFVASAPQLDDSIPVERKPFSADDTTDPATLDAIPDPSSKAALAQPSFASDFLGVEGVEVDNRKAKSQDLAGLDGTPGVLEKVKLKKKLWLKYVAPGAVASLCIALYAVPAVIRHSTGDLAGRDLEEQQTRLLVNDEVRYYSPRIQKPFILPKGELSVAPRTNVDPAESQRQSTDNEAILAARSAVASGDLDKGIEILEQALETNPLAVDTRVELIKLHIRKKQLKRARELAVLGMRLPGLTSPEYDKFWDMFMQCQEVNPFVDKPAAPVPVAPGQT